MLDNEGERLDMAVGWALSEVDKGGTVVAASDIAAERFGVHDRADEVEERVREATDGE